MDKSTTAEAMNMFPGSLVFTTHFIGLIVSVPHDMTGTYFWQDEMGPPYEGYEFVTPFIMIDNQSVDQFYTIPTTSDIVPPEEEC